MPGDTEQQPAHAAAAAPAPGAAAPAPTKADSAATAKPAAKPPSRLGVLNGVAGFLTFVGCIALHYVWELPETPTIGSVQPQHSTWLAPITVEDKLRVVALSFFVCASMFALLPGTPELRSRIVSSVHGIFSSYLAYRALLEVKGSGSWTDMMAPSWNDPIADKARYFYSIYPAVALCTAVTVGYIAYDSSLLLVDSQLLDWGMKIHHTVALLGFGSSLFSNFAMPLMAMVIANEASTYFVNNNFTWTKGNPINGLCMWLAYLFFRLVLNSLVALRIGVTLQEGVLRSQSDLAVYLVYTAGFVAVQILNIMWFERITSGLLRAIGVVKSKPKSAVAQNDLEDEVATKKDK